MARVSFLVAVARNGVIGRDNRIPWHIPADLRRFKELTMGHHIVMGRRTWESINRLLPGRTTVIVTRNTAFGVPGAKIARSVEEALQLCAGDSEIFVIGGAEIFRAALPYAQRIYLSAIEADVEGDTIMPPIDLGGWQLVSDEAHPAAPGNSLPWRFRIYDRVQSPEAVQR